MFSFGTEISEYLKLKYAAPSEACKCGNCQLVPPEVIWRTIGTIDALTNALKNAQVNQANQGKRKGWIERDGKLVSPP